MRVMVGVWAVMLWAWSGVAVAASQDVGLHVSNMTSKRWLLMNFSIKDNGDYQPRGGVGIEPRASKQLQIVFNHLPDGGIEDGKKFHIGHMELLLDVRCGMPQVHNTVELYIHGDSKRTVRWSCKAFSRQMSCRVRDIGGKKVISLVIGTR